MLVLLRFVVSEAEFPGFIDGARDAITALSECPGFVRARAGRSVEDHTAATIALEFVDVGSYRRAISSSEVKMRAIPLLSRAIDEPSAFEVVHSRGPEGVTDRPSSLAPDAFTVGLGEAAGPGSMS